MVQSWVSVPLHYVTADTNTSTEENAVNLVYGFLALHDNFDSPGFSEKRQGAMNALVACAPRKAAP